MGLFSKSNIARGLGLHGSQHAGTQNFLSRFAQSSRNALKDLPEITKRPDDPIFKSIMDKGKLQDPFQLKFRPGEEGSQFEQMLRDRALAEGPSKTAQNLFQQEDLQKQDMMDRLAGIGSAQAAQQFSGLASRGGAAGGAGERLASQIARQGALQRQGIQSESAQTKLGISSADEQQKMELQKMQANLANTRQRFNVGTRLEEIGSKRKFDENRFNAKLSEHLASKEAREQRILAATSGGIGGRGGFLGTGLVRG